jgi:hypothetical protein
MEPTRFQIQVGFSLDKAGSISEKVEPESHSMSDSRISDISQKINLQDKYTMILVIPIDSSQAYVERLDEGVMFADRCSILMIRSINSLSLPISNEQQMLILLIYRQHTIDWGVTVPVPNMV